MYTIKAHTLTPAHKWTGVAMLGLVLVVATALVMVNRQLASVIERQLNQNVEGDRFTVGQATLFPNLSLEIRQLTMLQKEHPDPPVAEIPRWRLSIQWSRIFSRVLVSNYLISRPNLHITLPQATEELLENVPLQERGWREAVYLFDPLKINELKIEDADVTYVDQEPSKPLHLPHLNLLAGDIRNLRSPDDTYPSNLNLDTHIFGSGRVEMKGRANVLAEPHAWSPCPSHLAAGALEPLLPVTGRYNVEVYGGVISAQGQLEYTAKGATEASLNSLMIEDARVDFAPPGRGPEKQDRPTRQWVRPRHARISRECGFVLIVGSTNGEFGFRNDAIASNFDLHVKIENTRMRAMNSLLRAYGSFNVTAGLFSLYSELSVKNGRVEGYIKPLFKEMKVFDGRQDDEKTLFHQLYEGLVGSLTKLLENKPREEVATRTDLSGPLRNPQTSTWQTLVNLIRNAFFKAVLPSLEKEIGSHR